MQKSLPIFSFFIMTLKDLKGIQINYAWTNGAYLGNIFFVPTDRLAVYFVLLGVN